MITIRDAKPDDISEICEIHLKAFPGFTLSLLGRRFLTLFYSSALTDASGILLIAEQNGKVLGFVTGTLEPEGYYKKLLKTKWYNFMVAASMGIIRNLVHAKHLIKVTFSALTYKGDKPPKMDHAALLSSIGVDPSITQSGVGKKLTAEFENQVVNRGISRVYLTTDRDNNEPVNQFYVRNNFQLYCEIEKAGKRIMNLYVKDITKNTN